MKAASISETSVNFCKPHSATTQMTAIFTLAAVRTSGLAYFKVGYRPGISLEELREIT
jgi:hypothetical protein